MRDARDRREVIGVAARATRPFGPGCAVARLCRYEVVRAIVFGLEDAERRPRDLRRDRELARTTLYNHVDQLFELGVVARRGDDGPSWQIVYEYGENGREFHQLLRSWEPVLRRTTGSSSRLDWFAPLHFGEAWAGGVVQALLDGPANTSQVIGACEGPVSRAQIERLLGQLRRHGYAWQPGRDHELTETGRLVIGRLAAGARFERRHMEEGSVPISVTDAVDAIRGTLPLIELPDSEDGICEFVARAGKNDPGPRVAACWAEIVGGRVVATGAGNADSATIWVQGTIDDWLGAVIDHHSAMLQSAGERRLGRGVVRELHAELYGRRR